MARRSRPHRPLFPRGAGVGFRAFGLAIAALALWFTDQRGVPALAQVRGVLATALAPVMSVSASPVSLSAATEQFRGRQALAAENRELREAQFALNARMLKFEALEAENRRLRQLVTSAAALGEKVLVTEIVAVSQDPYRNQITLDKGTRDGVYQGQALVDSHGVMGQVVHVNPTTATALFITDPGHGIPVEINRTGLQTIARGGGDGRSLVLPFLPGNADVQVGDLLVTSGLGGRFPPGYPVGEVFDVKRGTAVHFMQANAAPVARLYQGRQALLVWSDQPVVALEGQAEDAGETKAPAAVGSGAATATRSRATTPPPRGGASTATAAAAPSGAAGNAAAGSGPAGSSAGPAARVAAGAAPGGTRTPVNPAFVRSGRQAPAADGESPAPGAALTLGDVAGGTRTGSPRAPAGTAATLGNGRAVGSAAPGRPTAAVSADRPPSAIGAAPAASPATAGTAPVTSPTTGGTAPAATPAAGGGASSKPTTAALAAEGAPATAIPPGAASAPGAAASATGERSIQPTPLRRRGTRASATAESGAAETGLAPAAVAPAAPVAADSPAPAPAPRP